MSLVEALKYTGVLLSTASSKVAAEVGDIQRDLAQARLDLKSKRDNLSAAVADVARFEKQAEGARNEKSRAFFLTEAGKPRSFVPKLEADVKLLSEKVAALSKKDDALQLKWAKLSHDSDGMFDEASRLSAGGLA